MSITSATIYNNKLNVEEKEVYYKIGPWQYNKKIKVEFSNFTDLENYLKSFNKVYYYNIKMMRTFSGKILKPNKIYNITKDPAIIFVKEKDIISLLIVKSINPKEVLNFGEYCPLFLLNDSGKVKILNKNNEA
jgi:hypothetical protein